MDNLFLKRANSWQGLVKKEQEYIFEESIGLPHELNFLLKMRFWHTTVISNDLLATQTAPALKKIINSAYHVTIRNAQVSVQP